MDTEIIEDGVDSGFVDQEVNFNLQVYKVGHLDYIIDFQKSLGSTFLYLSLCDRVTKV